MIHLTPQTDDKISTFVKIIHPKRLSDKLTLPSHCTTSQTNNNTPSVTCMEDVVSALQSSVTVNWNVCVSVV